MLFVFVLSAWQSGVSIKLAAGESWCLVYFQCFQEASSKARIYNVASCLAAG